MSTKIEENAKLTKYQQDFLFFISFYRLFFLNLHEQTNEKTHGNYCE